MRYVVVLLVLGIVACDSGAKPGDDVGDDGTRDAAHGELDGGARDASREDAAIDVGPDVDGATAPMDASRGMDAGDAATDAGSDAALDAGDDAGDAGMDAALDAGDAAADAGSDAALDAGDDAGDAGDASIDAAADAGDDAGDAAISGDVDASLDASVGVVDGGRANDAAILDAAQDADVDAFVPECQSGAQEQLPCGINLRGADTRQCVGGLWGAWSGCVDPDVCVDTAMQTVACGTDQSGTAQETCVTGQWVQSAECTCASGLLFDCSERCVMPGSRRYVSLANSSCEDGLSWATAYTAIDSALATPASEVWVAAGTYYPGGPKAPPSVHFTIDRVVQLYGGFAGNETSLSQRDPVQNETVLSGDLNRNGVVDVKSSYHVLLVTADALIDGFVIEHGYASDPSLVSGNLDGNGGGARVLSASPVFHRCWFRENQATLGGGAVEISGLSHARFVRCVFEDNRAVIQFVANGGTQGNGGAMTMDDWPDNAGSWPEIVSCVFRNNVADQTGGALAIRQASPAIVNSVFEGNSALGYTGGAVDLSFGSNATFTSSTFVANTASSWGGGAVSAYYGAQVSLTNAIVWGNAPDALREILQSGAPAPSILASYSLIEGGWPGVSNLSADPLLTGAVPGAGSPAFDAGNAMLLPLDFADLDGDADLSEPLPLDLAKNARIQGSGLDLGAYEVSGP